MECFEALDYGRYGIGENTMLSTEDGPKLAKDIKTGDKILNSNFGYSEVLSKASYSRSRMVKFSIKEFGRKIFTDYHVSLTQPLSLCVTDFKVYTQIKPSAERGSNIGEGVGDFDVGGFGIGGSGNPIDDDDDSSVGYFSHDGESDTDSDSDVGVSDVGVSDVGDSDVGDSDVGDSDVGDSDVGDSDIGVSDIGDSDIGSSGDPIDDDDDSSVGYFSYDGESDSDSEMGSSELSMPANKPSISQKSISSALSFQRLLLVFKYLHVFRNHPWKDINCLSEICEPFLKYVDDTVRTYYKSPGNLFRLIRKLEFKPVSKYSSIKDSNSLGSYKTGLTEALNFEDLEFRYSGRLRGRDLGDVNFRLEWLVKVVDHQNIELDGQIDTILEAIKDLLGVHTSGDHINDDPEDIKSMGYNIIHKSVLSFVLKRNFQYFGFKELDEYYKVVRCITMAFAGGLQLKIAELVDILVTKVDRFVNATYFEPYFIIFKETYGIDDDWVNQMRLRADANRKDDSLEYYKRFSATVDNPKDLLVLDRLLQSPWSYKIGENIVKPGAELLMSASEYCSWSNSDIKSNWMRMRLAGIWSPKDADSGFDNELLYIDGWFIGIWLLDGATGTSVITNTSIEVVNRVKLFVKNWNRSLRPINYDHLQLPDNLKAILNKKEWLKLRCSVHKTKNLVGNSAYMILASSPFNAESLNPLINSLRKLGVYTDKSKSIQAITNLPLDYKLRIIAGHIDGDGSLVNNRFYTFSQLTDHHENIVEDLRRLVRLVGVRASTIKTTHRLIEKTGRISKVRTFYFECDPRLQKYISCTSKRVTRFIDGRPQKIYNCEIISSDQKVVCLSLPNRDEIQAEDHVLIKSS